MKIIIGLGNPTVKYENTRHNVGFKVMDGIAQNAGLSFAMESKFKAEIAKGLWGSEQVLLVKPQTFMNLSGEALALIMGYFKVEVADILIVYDDLSLDMGMLRFRANGSDGGHNGIKSIINMLSTNKFPRLKVGIGPQPQFMKSEAFVLQKFSSEQMDLLNKVVLKSVDAIEDYLNVGIATAQNKYNGLDLNSL